MKDDPGSCAFIPNDKKKKKKMLNGLKIWKRTDEMVINKYIEEINNNNKQLGQDCLVRQPVGVFPRF